MKPIFTIKKNETLHIGDEWISNGHWLMKKGKPYGITALDRLLLLKNTENPPDFDVVIPKNLEGYSAIKFTQKCFTDYRGEVLDYLFLMDDGSEKPEMISISPRYFPLLSLGENILAKDPNSPILICNDKEIIGMVMSRRIARSLND